MKRILSLLLMIAIVVVLTACGNAGSVESPQTPVAPASVPSGEKETDSSVTDNTGESETEDADMNTESDEIIQSDTESEMESQAEAADGLEKTETQILVAYFSRTGENYDVGYIEKGNTAIIADMIAEQTGGDTFEIITVTPYPEDYDECTDIAQQELNENARPELALSLDNLEDYDVIFLGYPIWWGDMPMAVYTFLESYDFSGKTIVPFCTHAGSGLASTAGNIAAACPDTEILDGLSIRGSVAQNSQEEAAEAVSDWLQQTGFPE